MPSTRTNRNYASAGKRPPAATALISLCCVAATLWVVTHNHSGSITSYQILMRFGVVPGRLAVCSLLTYPFFHESLTHLAINLLYLWLFGAAVERALGHLPYIAVFLSAGALGGLLQSAVASTLGLGASGASPIVGASAACAGLIGVYAVRYYRASFWIPGSASRVSVVALVALFLAVEIAGGLWSAATGFAAGGIAHWAHVGGFVFGLALAELLGLDRAGERDYLLTDAEVAMRRSEIGGAIGRWEKLLAANPRNVHARAQLARAWGDLGDVENSTAQYDLAIHTALEIGDRRMAAELYHEAHAPLDGAATKVVDDPRVAQRASASSHSGSADAARSSGLTGQELLAIAGELEAERPQQSLVVCRRIAALYPGSAEAETALLRAATLCVHRLRAPQEANELIGRLLTQYPHSALRAAAEQLRQSLSH